MTVWGRLFVVEADDLEPFDVDAFFMDELPRPTREYGGIGVAPGQFWYRTKAPIRAEGQTIVFRLEGNLIASAVLLKRARAHSVRDAAQIANGFMGWLLLDVHTLRWAGAARVTKAELKNHSARGDAIATQRSQLKLTDEEDAWIQTRINQWQLVQP